MNMELRVAKHCPRKATTTTILALPYALMMEPIDDPRISWGEAMAISMKATALPLVSLALGQGFRRRSPEDWNVTEQRYNTIM